MAAIGRVVLIIAAVAAPWVFGCVQAWPQFALAAVVAVLTFLRMFEAVVNRPDKSAHIPLVSIALLALLLIGAVQLLPRPESPAAHMDHAVFAMDAVDFGGSVHVATGTLSAASTRREAARLYFALAAFLLSAYWFSSRAAFRPLFGALTLNGVALGAFGIIQSLSWNGRLFWTVELRFGGTPFASYVNRNNAAGYLNLCLGAAIGFAILVLAARRHKPQISAELPRHVTRLRTRIRHVVAGIEGRHLVVIASLSVLVAAILFSLSRGGIVAMAIAGIAVIATAFRGTHRNALLVLSGIVAAAACGLLLFAGQFETVDDRLATLGDPLAAVSGRLQHWQDTFGAVRDFPILGTGLGTYRFANQPYQTRPAHAWYYNADNEWFEILVEAGAVGFSAAAIGLLLMAASSIFLLKQEDPSWRAMGSVGLFVVLSQGLQAVTDFGIILPANGLTLAVISGAVCGAACRASEFHRLHVPTWLSLAQLDGRASQALLATVLALTGSAFLLELFTATRSQAIQDVRIDLVPDSTRVAAIDAAIDEAEAVLKYRPDDAELHDVLGRWWIDRYRLQMYSQLLSEIPDPQPAQRAEFWKLASLPSLALRARQFEAAGQMTDLNRFLSLEAVHDNLFEARKHFENSFQQCALGRRVSLALARLAFLQGKTTNLAQIAYLRKARFVAPSTPSVLIETGMLASASGERELANNCWRRALECSPKEGHLIWQYATQTASPEEVMNNTLPPRADVLVGIAEETPDGSARTMLLNRAEQLLEQDSDGTLEGTGAIIRAKLADLQSRPNSAIRYYQLALSEQPWEIEWRLRLARILRTQGRLSEAAVEYSLLSQQAPERRDIQTEHRSLQLEMQEQGGSGSLTNDEP